MNKIITVGLAVAIGFVAQADVLYWMVSDAIAETATSGGTSDFAALYVKDSADPSSLSPNPYKLSVKTEGDVYSQYNDLGNGFEYSGIQNYSADTFVFYVEILSGDYAGKRSSELSYSQLADYILKGGNSLPVSTLDPIGFGGGTSTYNVPEPTSGLLSLIGGMLLGLRRRRQQV